MKEYPDYATSKIMEAKAYFLLSVLMNLLMNFNEMLENECTILPQFGKQLADLKKAVYLL